MLAQLLNFHPQVVCGGEWTGHLRPWQKISGISRAFDGDFRVLKEKNRRHLLDNLDDKVTHLGFRALFRSSDKWLFNPEFSLTRMYERLGATLRWLAGRPDIAVLHLCRDDHLAWLSSYLLSRETGRYFRTVYPDDLKVSISPREALKRIQSKVSLDARLAELQKTNPYLPMTYEALSSQMTESIGDALGFLGLSKDNYSIDTELLLNKQSQGAVSDRFENYLQIKATLDRWCIQ